MSGGPTVASYIHALLEVAICMPGCCCLHVGNLLYASLSTGIGAGESPHASLPQKGRHRGGGVGISDKGLALLPSGGGGGGCRRGGGSAGG